MRTHSKFVYALKKPQNKINYDFFPEKAKYNEIRIELKTILYINYVHAPGFGMSEKTYYALLSPYLTFVM